MSWNNNRHNKRDARKHSGKDWRSVDLATKETRNFIYQSRSSQETKKKTDLIGRKKACENLLIPGTSTTRG
jgi:hypothetical protein